MYGAKALLKGRKPGLIVDYAKFQCSWICIRIPNTDPDPGQPNKCGFMRIPNHNTGIKQCCGSGMFIPDPDLTFFHPGSRIRTLSIPDPGSASKNLSILYILTQKNGFYAVENMIRVVHRGSRIPDPGVKKTPDPGSGSATPE
jgi:hypothetical protein